MARTRRQMPWKKIFKGAFIASHVLLWVYVIALTGAISGAFSNVDHSIREVAKRFSVNSDNNKFSEANFGFGLDIDFGFGWLGVVADYIWSPGGGIAIGIALVYFFPKLRQSIKSRRRTRRPASATPSA